MASRTSQELSFGERLANEAQRARDMAGTLHPSKKPERNETLYWKKPVWLILARASMVG